MVVFFDWLVGPEGIRWADNRIVGIYMTEVLTEQCPTCLTINHIEHWKEFAWECKGCTSRWWISDVEKARYMNEHGLTHIEADINLDQNLVPCC